MCMYIIVQSICVYIYIQTSVVDSQYITHISSHSINLSGMHPQVGIGLGRRFQLTYGKLPR